MASLASNALGRIKEIWGRLNPVQRWLTGGLGLALVGAVGVAVYLNRPEWVTLVNRADPKDAAAIVARLDELKVTYRPSGDSTITIEVPASDQYTAKLALAQAGLPQGNSVGLELFNEPKFGATEFDRRVNYLRAQQGELERALLRMAELDYAKVQLAIPEQSVFVREQQPVTAAVLVHTRAGKRLAADQVNGIVNFIAGSVQGLSEENVKIVDQTGRLLSNGLASQANLTSGLDNEQLERQLTLQRDLEHRVQSMLEPIFGASNVVARVSLELNNDTSRIESTTVGQSVPKQTQTSRESAQGTQTGGNATTDPNSPPIYQGDGGAGSANDLWRTTTTTDYAVSERKETTLVAPGSVKRIAVGIAVNLAEIAPDRARSIQEMVANAVGADLTAVSVTAMPFNITPSVTLPVAGNAKSLLQPTTLAIGGGLALLLLVAGFLLSRRRSEDDAEEEVITLAPQLAGVPGASVGTTLDVALGLSQSEADLPEGELPDDADEVDGSLSPARQKLEKILKERPKRKIVLDEQPIDEELVAIVDDLLNTSSEASADTLRQWLKGGH